MSLQQQSWHLGESFPVRVMALMLRDPEFLPKFHGDIQHHYFDRKDLCTLAYLVLNFFHEREKISTRNEVIDMIVEHATTYDSDGTLELRDTLIRWLDFCFEYVIGDENFIRDRVRKFAVRQRVKAALGQTVALLEAEKPEDDEFEVVGKIQRLFDEACRASAAEDLGTTFESDGRDLPRIMREDALYGLTNKVPTGIGPLDLALNGGLGVPELGVLAGPPNRGKTTNLCVFGANAARHFREQFVAGRHPNLRSVIHITCESVEHDIKVKYGANLTGLEMDDIPKLEAAYQEQYDTLIGQLGPVHVKYFPQGSTTADEVKWYIANLVMAENVKPGLIILDYADKLRGGEDNRFVGMGQIYDTLISITNKFKCPMWTGSQINRAFAEQEIITGAGLAESWKKFESSDVVVTLCQKQEEADKNQMRLYTAKVRRGRARQFVYCHSIPGKVHLSAMTEDEIKQFGFKRDGEDPDEQADRLTKIKNKAKKIGVAMDAKSETGAPALNQTAFQNPAFAMPNGDPGNAAPAAPSADVSPPTPPSAPLDPLVAAMRPPGWRHG
jgi:replicative DNA helicase